MCALLDHVTDVKCFVLVTPWCGGIYYCAIYIQLNNGFVQSNVSNDKVFRS